MKTRTAAIMALFGLLVTFGAVGGMEDPAKMDYFVEQFLAALVGLLFMWVGVLGLQNSDVHDER